MKDPFTDHVFRNMSPEVRATFTDAQALAIQEALARAQQTARARHLLDIRFSIPFYWARYYVVLLLGRDERARIRTVLKQRRVSTSRLLRGLGVLALLGMTFVGLVVVVLFVLYLLKSWMGVDFFPERHLRDFLIP